MSTSREHRILALDLATVTGWALGAPGDIPSFGTVRFASEGASQNAVFAGALTWFANTLKAEPRPTSIIVEAMLPPQALKGHTQRKTRDLLAGLHAILRAVAYSRGIYEIADVSTLAVRKHFCGSARAQKQDVWDRCKLLGWQVATRDESDACATWHFACALVRPEIAIETSPLFMPGRKRPVGAKHPIGVP